MAKTFELTTPQAMRDAKPTMNRSYLERSERGQVIAEHPSRKVANDNNKLGRTRALSTIVSAFAIEAYPGLPSSA